jgi:hypothetical protein
MTRTYELGARAAVWKMRSASTLKPGTPRQARLPSDRAGSRRAESTLEVFVESIECRRDKGDRVACDVPR